MSKRVCSQAPSRTPLAIVPLLAALACTGPEDERLTQVFSQLQATETRVAENGYEPAREPFSGALAPGESTRLSIALEGEVDYEILGVCDHGCQDVDLAIFDKSGGNLVEDVLTDDFPVLAFTASDDGDYEIEVRMVRCSDAPCAWGVQSFRKGGVALSAQDEASDSRLERGALADGDSTLSTGEYVDSYEFEGTEGEEVVVDLVTSEFDPYLMVIAPDSSQEENDDYEGDRGRSLVRYTLPSTGSYRVAVTSYQSGETGAYELSIARSTGGSDGSTPVVAQGDLAAGDDTLSSGEYVDEHVFQGAPGEHVRVDLRSGAFDTYVMLLGPGDFREENDDVDEVGHSAIEAELTAAGTYRVLVTSYEPGEVGSYDLRVERTRLAAAANQRDIQSLDVDGVATGVLEDGDQQLESGEYQDTWAIDGIAGQTLTVDLESDDFDTYLMLVSPTGDTLDENDDTDNRRDLSRVWATLDETGRYRVVATTYAADEVGSYELSARLGASPNAPVPSPEDGGRVYGVFVGLSEYGGRLNDLAYTADDAHRAVEAVATGTGMAAGDYVVLTDDEATVANVRAAFEDMSARVGSDDTFVYFFSGHGGRVDRDGPERPDPDGIDETIELYDDGLRDNEFGALLDLIDSRLALVVLDSCFSGGFSKDVISVPGRMGLFSSEEDVTSQVAAKFRAGGHLARFVLDAVGDGLADANADSAISAIELSQYLHERYREGVKSSVLLDYVRTGGPQTGYQHLVADRGGVRPSDVVFELTRP